MKLKGIKLEVVSISRKGLFDSDMAYSCENCGKTIVNYANVTDGTKSYIIGLDCKKTLIDKPMLDGLKSDDFTTKWNAKEYRKELNEVNKFLLESSRDNTKVSIDNFGTIFIHDSEKLNQFGNKGLTTYCNNVGFLYRMGLKPYIQKLMNVKTS